MKPRCRRLLKRERIRACSCGVSSAPSPHSWGDGVITTFLGLTFLALRLALVLRDTSTPGVRVNPAILIRRRGEERPSSIGPSVAGTPERTGPTLTLRSGSAATG